MAENAFHLPNLVCKDRGCDGLQLRLQRRWMTKNHPCFTFRNKISAPRIYEYGIHKMRSSHIDVKAYYITLGPTRLSAYIKLRSFPCNNFHFRKTPKVCHRYTSVTSSAEHGVSVDNGPDITERCSAEFSISKPIILSKIFRNFPKWLQIYETVH
jgi:hypothetical protein